MLLHYLHHPEHFTYPRRVLSVFSPKVPERDVPAYLERNLEATLLMFHVHGDDNRRHNLSGAPMLDPITGLLFLAGLVLVARGKSRPIAFLLLAWVPVMLLPSLLSVEGVPHGLRSCGVLPAVALLGGIALDSLYSLMLRRSGPRLAAAPAVLGPKDTPRLVLNGRPALVAFIQRDDRIVDLIRRLNPGATVVEVRDGGVSPESPVYRVN